MKRILSLAAIAGVFALLVMSFPTLQAADAAPAAAPDRDTDKALAEGNAMIEKALAFLKTQQQPDGSWQKSDKEPPAISAIVLRAFALDPKTGPKADFVKKGYDKLLTYQLDAGGIYKDLLANYNTAIAVSALAAGGDDPKYKEAIEKAVKYLKSLQWTDTMAGGPKGEGNVDPKDPRFGGVGYGRAGRPDGSSTQIYLEALHDAGLSKDDPAYKKALVFISRMQNNTESNPTGEGWTVGEDGGFIYTPANKGESFAGEYTGADGKRMLRSYGSMTYAGLKSMIYCGLTKDDLRVKAAWKWITQNWTVDENPGMKLGDPKNAHFGLFYYYHTMARALAAYGEPLLTDPQGVKHDWRVELIHKLAALQQKDGSFVGDAKWMEDNATLTTAYVVLGLQEAVADIKAHPAK